MGTLFRAWKTIPMPPGATVRKNIVTWTVRGKKRTGKLSGSGKVSIQVDTWTVQFTDETGKVRRVSTKTTNRSAAEKMLARHETDIDRIRAGVLTRNELTKAPLRTVTLDGALEQFQTKMVSNNCTPHHIYVTMRRLLRLLKDCGVEAIADIRRENIERWIAGELQKRIRSMRTINGYLGSIKSFVSYLVDIELLPNNPLKTIRKLNQELDRRKVRRAMTAEEIEQLLAVADNERRLVYRLLLGTGLRSTELSLLTPGQIDFERCRLRVEATKTKNRKADVLPLRPDLVQAVKEWMTAHETQSHERFFLHNQESLRHLFYQDLKAAGIKGQVSPTAERWRISDCRTNFARIFVFPTKFLLLFTAP